jgi:hypothetical protein
MLIGQMEKWYYGREGLPSLAKENINVKEWSARDYNPFFLILGGKMDKW